MPLTPFTGVVSASVLNDNFDLQTAQLTTNSAAGQKDQLIFVWLASLTSATALSLRTVAWTQQDDAELRIVMARGTADAAGRNMTATLTVDGGVTGGVAGTGDDTFLVDNTISATTATSVGAGAVDSRPSESDYRTTTGTRLRLLKGVRYRLTMVCNTAGTFTDAEAIVQCRSLRRLA